MEEEIIREYKPDDKSVVERCILELQEDESIRQPEYWQTGEKSIEDGYLGYLLKHASSNNGKLLVAEVGGVAVGYIAVIIENEKDASPCVKMKHAGYVPDFVVLREYQKRGIGKRLLEAAEQYVKSQGCEYLALDVTTGNPAHDFYEKLGYREFSVNMKKKL